MACRKLYYATRKEAKIKKKNFENKFKKKICIYNCPICKGYHFTTHTSIEDKEFFRRLKTNNQV